ncbi:cobalt-precorrin-6X reductase [Roseovarius atlanticus]|uniref:Cobalt-precorrin-6X reductase n=1 Tax=Roseovarius atlanticus TaxID=1641875 RepID=A0A0T5NSS0_9RHOB|nr:cobalt-precorrin-6A reductase [Roseovarius atlanticus]KRS11840.1 cobalt-precorrin-6X reductase [Roseovarius atlanticus]
MTPTVLLLGGTTEAMQMGQALAAQGVRATISLAGRVKTPADQPLPVRVGGFGGVDGLVAHLKANGVTHLIDATHPFAAQMSANAVSACDALDLPLLALTRAPWQAGAQDRWTHVPDMEGAVAALSGRPRRVFLALGRMNLPAFAAQPQHDYLLRLVDAPGRVPLPKAQVVVDRGPFEVEGDLALMRAHGTELVVSKNAGGTGAQAKIIAARQLGLPVVMIDRPAIPARTEAHSVEEVLSWLHGATARGV